MQSFIETQFPIARLSAESYKERKGASSQTLPKLGKWWGRKPLILVRASILGMLMPASADPKKDREIFLKLLTMDDAGLWARCKPSVKRKTTRHEFDQLAYADRIANCDRPENIDGPSSEAWDEINAHLGTKANSLQELVDELGQRTFGHTPRVGDSFCGGGSIPFEAARIGCEAFGSDLNPVAGLLTWASLNILSGGTEIQKEVMKVQGEAFAATDRQITTWGIEHNEKGERAEAYLYCVEVKPDGCEYYIPLSPNWVISEKFRIVANWQKSPNSDRLVPTITQVTDTELKLYQAKKGATIGDSRVIDPFDLNRSWSIEALRGTNGLRRWSNSDVMPRSGDVFQERLYCIRWVNAQGERRYAPPDVADMERESKVLSLLQERFDSWQRDGFIPSKLIASGYNTDQPIRERGWTHWHHLFTPRQLLINGLLSHSFANFPNASLEARIGGLLGVGSASDFNSRLCRWIPHLAASGGIGAFAQTFYNQALNTLFNWGVRSLGSAKTTLCSIPVQEKSFFPKPSLVKTIDARDIKETCDFWITDPPYADAVNYHELGDFFLAWYDKQLLKAFPEWIPDARAELAVKGDGEDFRRSMVEIYQNLARFMPDNGMQMVMFTHQDPAVWADLGMILWAAGLKATAAWTISTETQAAGIKKGNYVQGTVCLVLRKRISNEPGFLDEVYPLVEDEVKRQISSMQSLDEGSEPNFNDADYQLAAYAAALKVLTQYGNLDGKDVEHEVFAVREKNQKSDFEIVIERALGIACDTLIPRGLDNSWRDLSLVERYYLRALDIESRGERRQGMYEELARGFGVTDIKPLLKNDKANGARMYTPSGLASTLLGTATGAQSSDLQLARRGRAGSSVVHPFASSALRHLMFAVYETAAADNSPEPGRQYLRDTFGQAYWTKRESFVALLEWLSALGNTEDMNEWADDSEASRILAGRLRNDHG
jgi:putative DNA methylase